MSKSKNGQTHVNRRDFMTGAAATATVFGMPWQALAQGVPNEFDGSKFQLAAPEANPKRGGVLKYAITSRPPHFDM
ncbi:MAG: twin-arginine translocation signal domain-containing protein, partial [Alphaproteobacteria bacterium]|nr:twin-arginine translocation signal domain-containing protein [Alphaproteobacteria bacterium]